jgi:hypothetical protein
MNPPDLVELTQRERERSLLSRRLARLAACQRACLHPSRIERLARAIGLSPAGC